MQSPYPLFTPLHLLTLFSIPAIALALTLAARAGLSPKVLRLSLAWLLILTSAAWYVYLGVNGWLEFPSALPLELCDITLLLTVIALLTLSPLAVDLSYYGALAGTTMALITPDVWEAFPSLPTIQFFVAHGLVVASVLVLVWTKQARPRPGSVWRAFAAVNVFALIAGTFNVIFDTNYMYLSAKPANPSLLDYLGPWPWYILSCEAVAAVLFTLLWLPFRRGPR